MKLLFRFFLAGLFLLHLNTAGQCQDILCAECRATVASCIAACDMEHRKECVEDCNNTECLRKSCPKQDEKSESPPTETSEAPLLEILCAECHATVASCIAACDIEHRKECVEDCNNTECLNKSCSRPKDKSESSNTEGRE